MHQPSGLLPSMTQAHFWGELTEREGQTLALLIAGLSNKQIGRELGIGEGTVKIYVRNLLRKFRLNSRLELVTRVNTGASSWRVLDEELPGKEAEGTANAPNPVAAKLLNDLPGLIYRGGNDRSWSMDYVSAGCLALTGYPADYHSEHGFGMLILEEYADYIWYCVQCSLLKGDSYQLDYRIRCADGQIKRVWETGVGIYSPSGEVVGLEGAIFERRC